MRSLRSPASFLLSVNWSPWLGFLLSLLVGLSLYSVTAKTIEADATERFRGMARAAQYTISARIKSYTDVLRGAAGLFRANPVVTREQFHHYVDQLEIKHNFPGIEVLNYARAITAAERPAIEERLRAELAEDGYEVRGPLIKPPGQRDSYTVMLYIEPREKIWLSKIGMDLEGRNYTRKVLADSRDANLLTASGTRIPILSGANRHGLAMRLPVYRSDMPSQTVEERRAAYVGTVGMGFGVNRLVQGVLDEFPVKGTRLTLIDLTPVPPEPGESVQSSVLFDSEATPANPTPHLKRDDPSAIAITLPIEFNQRVWEANFSIPKAELYSGLDMYTPWLAMLAGFVTTGLLYALYQALASSRRSAMRIADSMTRELRASQNKLQSSNEKLRRLAAHAEQIKEGERKRIAREIHDDLAQNLLALRIEAEMLTSRTRGSHARLHQRAGATLHQIDVTIKSVRQIINDLRPNVLDLGLNAAVDWQVADFRRRTGIQCDLIDDGEELRVDDRCDTALFRILQESLNNIARHASATKVRIELRLRDGILCMSISDNGVGLQPGSRNRQGSFGLVGIEERVNILGGTFSIVGEPGCGTRLVVRVPTGSQLAEVPDSADFAV